MRNTLPARAAGSSDTMTTSPQGTFSVVMLVSKSIEQDINLDIL